MTVYQWQATVSVKICIIFCDIKFVSILVIFFYMDGISVLRVCLGWASLEARHSIKD